MGITGYEKLTDEEIESKLRSIDYAKYNLNREKAQSVLNSLNDDCYIHMNEATECAYKDGFVDGADYTNNEYVEIIKQYYDYASKHWTTRRRRWEAGYLAAMHDIFVACFGEEALIKYKLEKE